MHKVIELALAEVGYLEKSKSAWKQYGKACLIPKTEYAGSDNYTIYGYEMHEIYPQVMDFPAYWCDAFNDAMFQRAYGVSNAKGMIGGFDDYTKGSIQLYKNFDAFFLRGKKSPLEGDQIFFSKDGTLAGVNHTGLVRKVEGGKVYTIEGNASNNSATNNGGGVVEKVYDINDPRIYGYGRPNYSKYEKIDGWAQVGEDWYYYKDGVKLKREWIKDGGHWFRVGIDGKMLKGWHQIYDSEGNLCNCYFGDDGVLWHEREDHQGYMEPWTI